MFFLQIVFDFGAGLGGAARISGHWSAFDSYRMEARLVSTNEALPEAGAHLCVDEMTHRPHIAVAIFVTLNNLSVTCQFHLPTFKLYVFFFTKHMCRS